MTNWLFGPASVMWLMLMTVCQAQQDTKSKPLQDRGYTIQLDNNPFRETPTISARIALIDRASPSLGWFTIYGGGRKDGELTTYLNI